MVSPSPWSAQQLCSRSAGFDLPDLVRDRCAREVLLGVVVPLLYLAAAFAGTAVYRVFFSSKQSPSPRSSVATSVSTSTSTYSSAAAALAATSSSVSGSASGSASTPAAANAATSTTSTTTPSIPTTSSTAAIAIDEPIVLPFSERVLSVAKLAVALAQAALCAHWYQYRAGRDQRAPFYALRPAVDAALWLVAAVLAAPYAASRFYRGGRWIDELFFVVMVVAGWAEAYVVFIADAHDNAADRRYLLATALLSTLLFVLAFVTPHHYAGEQHDADIVVAAGDARVPTVGCERRASWFSTVFFNWLNPLFALGASRQLAAADVPHLMAGDLSVNAWKHYRAVRNPRRGMLWNLFKAMRVPVFKQFVVSMVELPLRYSQPWLLQQILRHLQDPAVVSRKQAYFFAFMLLVSGVLASSMEQYLFFQASSMDVQVRGILGTELGSKAIRRPGKGTVGEASDSKDGDTAAAAGSNSDSADADADDDEGGESEFATDGRVLNLVSTDVQRFMNAVYGIDWLYAAPITLAIGIYYMYAILGVASFVGMAVLLLSYPVNLSMFARADDYLDKINSIGDKRVAMINEMLQGIRIIKLFGWSDRFVERIREVREKQLEYLRLMYYAWRAVFTSVGTVPLLIILSSFGTHTYVLGNTLTADQAFTYSSVILMVRQVCDYFPGYVREVIGALSSLRRIERFLAQPDIEALEDRVRADLADSGDGNGATAVAFVDASFEWQSAPPAGAAVAASASASGDMTVSTSATSAATSAAETPDAISGAVTPDLSHAAASSAADLAAVNAGLLGAATNSKTAGRGKARHFRLRNINLAFPAGKLSIIGGPTGCGKTSVLLALLGEMRHTGGSISIPVQPASGAALGSDSDSVDLLGTSRIRNVAYVAQEAWLRGGSIRDNILFNQPFDGERYRAVIRMCSLEPDLALFKAGDRTEIGEKGQTLSGGQKQRVSLARAVYSRAQILLLDDCLSAVDSHTAKHILDECLTNFASPVVAGRTIILVTHHINLCLHGAAYVVCMKNGRVTAAGAPDAVIASGRLAEITELVDMPPSRSGSSECAEPRESHPDAMIAPTPAMSAAPTVSTVSTASVSSAADGADDAVEDDGRLTEDEERESGGIKLDVLLTYVRAGGGVALWVVVFLSYFVTQFVTTLQDYWTRVWVDDLNNGVARPTLYYLSGYCVVALVFVVVKYSQATVVYNAHVDAASNIHERLLQRIARATPRFFDQTPIGRIVTRFGKDISKIDEVLVDNLTWFFHALCSALGVLAVIAYVTPVFLVLAAVILVVYGYIGYYFLASSRELKRLESVAHAPILSIFSEIVRGATTIRAFGAQDQLILESLGHSDVFNRAVWVVWATNRWISMRINTIGSFVSFFAAVLILLNAERLGPGMAGLSLSYALAFSMDAMWAVRVYGFNEINFTHVERCRQYMDIEQEAPAIIEDQRPPASWPHAGRVDVRDLVVEYKRGVPVLHGLTFSAAPGERVGIVGKTGAGKSTWSIALLRFVEAARGSITIDGIDISTIGLDDLRRNVSIIPQDPVLFNGTVRSNLDPFDEHDDSVLWEALRRSHLVKDRSGAATAATSTAAATEAATPAAHAMQRRESHIATSAGEDVVITDEDEDVFHDLEAPITENGGNLSLGQRQLVSIARALVRRSRIVILDEASSSIDFKTDTLIQSTIRSELAGRSTIFTIAHRLKTIVDYDRVLVLDKGRIVEFDTPATLLATDGSVFRGMCQASGEFDILVQIANDTAAAKATAKSA